MRVSPLCDHCYAMMLDIRWFKGAYWGPVAPRRYFGETHWREPLKWERLAQIEGRRHRVFCASMADVFDNEADRAVRNRLWRLIRQTPHLDWIVLTKRIGNAPDMLPGDWGKGYPNVWLLVSVDQTGLERDAPKLLGIPAVVHGLSIEPQLAPVDLGRFADRLQWVINGGESGPERDPFISNGRALWSPSAAVPAQRFTCRSSAATRSKAASVSASMTTPAATAPSGLSICESASSQPCRVG